MWGGGHFKVGVENQKGIINLIYLAHHYCPSSSFRKCLLLHFYQFIKRERERERGDGTSSNKMYVYST